MLKNNLIFLFLRPKNNCLATFASSRTAVHWKMLELLESAGFSAGNMKMFVLERTLHMALFQHTYGLT